MTQEKHKSNSAQLSLNIRKMKFMQRCLGEEERRELEESKRIITDEHWELDMPSLGDRNQKFEIIKSLLYCQSYYHGRLSFGGFNKSVEKLMKELNYFQDKVEPYVESVDVSDNEMAEHYLSLEGTLGKRFNRNNAPKKRFIDNENNADIPSKAKRIELDERGFRIPQEE